MTHYVGMAGLHGCLPATCHTYDTIKDAAESLAQIHDLGKRRTDKLKRDGYLELRLHEDGNEYCEILSCNCSDPDVHND